MKHERPERVQLPNDLRDVLSEGSIEHLTKMVNDAIDAMMIDAENLNEGAFSFSGFLTPVTLNDGLQKELFIHLMWNVGSDVVVPLTCELYNENEVPQEVLDTITSFINPNKQDNAN